MRADVSIEESRKRPLVRRLLVLGSCLIIAACGTACGSDTAPTPATPSSTARAAADAPPGGQISITVPGTLAADFAELEQSGQGDLGLAIMPVGGSKSVGLGEWTTGPAWSTMKVPLVIAAGREGSSGRSYAASAAITSSDNSAAETLWSGLGTPQQTAAAVQAVLREGGDTATVVPEKRTRSQYSAFGQADWALADQVRFASALPCLPGTEEVLELMDSVNSSQQWGLGSVFSSAQYKGGWGPDAEGAYLVRQFGLVPAGAGMIAIALAAQPDTGSFADGVDLLDQVATLISQHLGEFSGGSCAA